MLTIYRIRDETVIASCEDYRMRKEARIYIHKLTDPSLYSKLMSKFSVKYSCIWSSVHFRLLVNINGPIPLKCLIGTLTRCNAR